jgi:hypothetical protein
MLKQSYRPPAIDSKRRAGRRRGLGRSDIDDHIGDFFDARGALNDRTRPMLFDERGRSSSTETPFATGIFFSMSTTPSDKVGPGRTALTVTPVPARRVASPREIDNCAVLVKP